MLSFIRRLATDRAGSTAIAYGLLTAMVGVAVIGGASGLGDAFTGLATDVSTTLTEASGGTASGDDEAAATSGDGAAEPTDAADDGWFDLGLDELLGGGSAASTSSDGDSGLQLECDPEQNSSADDACPQ